MTDTLVTGAQGYVGRYVVSSLIDSGKSVVGVGRSEMCNEFFTHSFNYQSGTKRAPLTAEIKKQIVSSLNYKYEKCDLSDALSVKNLIQKHSPSTIIHLAGALRDESWDNLVSSNINTTFNLLKESSNLENKPVFILGSTGSVYGNQERLPIAETAFPTPIGSYATSKYMSEIMAKDIALNSSMPLIIARIFNIVGPGLQSRHLAGYLAHRIAEIEKLESENIITVGDLNTIRDFIDVRDVANFMTSDHGDCDSNFEFNIAGGEETEIKTIVDTLFDSALTNIILKTDSSRNRSGANRVYSSIDKMKAIYTPQYTLQQSLKDMLDYARLSLS